MWSCESMDPEHRQTLANALATYIQWLSETGRNYSMVGKLTLKVRSDDCYVFSDNDTVLATNAVTYVLCNCEINESARDRLLWLNDYFVDVHD